MRTKKSTGFYLALVIFSLIGQVAWVVENMYFNVFIYKMFHASADAISAMVAASAVISMVCFLIGLALSFLWILPTGASVVACDIAALLIASLVLKIRKEED